MKKATLQERFPIGTKVRPQVPALHSWTEGEVIGYDMSAWPMPEIHVKVIRGNNKFEAEALVVANEIEAIQ